jgi:hypothetical protein
MLIILFSSRNEAGTHHVCILLLPPQSLSLREVTLPAPNNFFSSELITLFIR